MIELQKNAPQFSLLNQEGKNINLSDFVGKYVLLYFYPKDDTPGCTTEACQLRDDFMGFEKISAVILGISNDTVESHLKFAKKYNLPFNLLADTDKKVSADYGVYQSKNFFGKKIEGIKRMSFLISPEQKILKIYKKVNPLNHAKEVLADLEKFQKN